MTPFVRSTLVVTLTFAGHRSARFRRRGRGGAFRGETTVNVVEVPVRVVDQKTGEPVVGLTAADFEILEDGVLQPISNFAELWRSEDDAVDVGGFDPEPLHTGSEDIRTRTVELVYLFDLFLMNKEGRNRAIDGLRSAYQRWRARRSEHQPRGLRRIPRDLRRPNRREGRDPRCSRRARLCQDAGQPTDHRFLRRTHRHRGLGRTRSGLVRAAAAEPRVHRRARREGPAGRRCRGRDHVALRGGRRPAGVGGLHSGPAADRLGARVLDGGLRQR